MDNDPGTTMAEAKGFLDQMTECARKHKEALTQGCTEKPLDKCPDEPPKEVDVIPKKKRIFIGHSPATTAERERNYEQFKNDEEKLNKGMWVVYQNGKYLREARTERDACQGLKLGYYCAKVGYKPSAASILSF